jgi:hypothetical protein
VLQLVGLGGRLFRIVVYDACAAVGSLKEFQAPRVKPREAAVAVEAGKGSDLAKGGNKKALSPGAGEGLVQADILDADACNGIAPIGVAGLLYRPGLQHVGQTGGQTHDDCGLPQKADRLSRPWTRSPTGDDRGPA